MAVKRILARAEVGARSVIPLQRRLESAESGFRKWSTKASDLEDKIASENRVVSAAKSALKLSTANEKAAESRQVTATGERELAQAGSDLKSAQKLSGRSRSTIRGAEKKLAKLDKKLNKVQAKEASRLSDVTRLKAQLKAQKATAPTRAARIAGALRTKVKPAPAALMARKVVRKTASARIPIQGTSPVVRRLGLKPGDVFVVPAGKVERSNVKKFGGRKGRKF